MNKQEARKIALSLRKDKDSKVSSRIVLDDIIASRVLDKYKHIGIYYPIGSEIDITPLVSIYKDKSFYLPITKDEISFVRYKENDELVNGVFHTLEPKGEIVKRDLIECFIIPCVAISNLKRIGYGKGYYDRYLKDYKGLIIGICYKDSIFEFDMDDYDCKLDMIFVGWFLWSVSFC